MLTAIQLALLALAFVVGVGLVPFGLPGLWVIVLAVIGYAWWTGFAVVGGWTIVTVVGLAAVAEVLELWTGFRLTRRFGGSSRAAWGALAGGIAGAVIGVPVPLIGSVIGAFVGAFLGAAVLELTLQRSLGGVARVGWGAVVGRAIAATLKIGVGLVIGVVTLFAILNG